MTSFDSSSNSNGSSEGGKYQQRGNRRGGKFSRFGKIKIVAPEEPIDYKNLDYLAKHVLPTGKIVSRRRSSFSGQNQRRLAIAIKRARFLGLLPYVGRA